MAMFSGAHDLVVNGGQFNNFNINNGPSGIDILLEASVPDAAVDSEARRYAPSCFPGTREQYIEDITNWANTSSDGQECSIYWMRGPAGVGKSAIAQTCAKKAQDSGHLGAAFFFSVNGRSDHTRFFTTLAYQLSTGLLEYRQILDTVVGIDKTLVAKAMSSQFNNLVVKPLRELAKQGKGVRRQTIFIDGLDECSSVDAQSEIIEIIAASVRDKTTPFRWAIFSRSEAQIVSTFERPDISPYTSTVLLPVSRDCDREIEIYLRSGFENTLRRRNLPLSPSWPTDGVIQRLVDASAGLFVYPAAVLRFIDRHSYSGFKERLEAVLDAILRPNARQPHSPFADLDAFYILIMKRIPKDLLPSALLLLGRMIEIGKFNGKSWSIAILCNSLGLSDADTRGTLNALEAVLILRRSREPPILDLNIDPARSCLDQERRFSPILLTDWIDEAYGTVNFHHKSFYDFLIDPARSSTFCVTTPTLREKLFDCHTQRHIHYAQSFVIQDAKLTLDPNVSSTSVSLSWPQGNEFADSFILLSAFCNTSRRLSHDIYTLAQYLEDMPRTLLEKLAELDYRKSLACEMSIEGRGPFTNGWVIGYLVGEARSIAGTQYRRVMPRNFSTLDLVAFLKMVKKLDELEIIRTYHHHLPSTFASAYYSLSQLKPSGKRYGQYRLGRGEKSVIWYWEFDTEKEYFHEFQTMNYFEAKRIYETEKFKMWEDGWEMPS